MSLYREDLLKALPYARRYARALSGSQSTGDALVADSLRDLLDTDGPVEPADGEVRPLLYGAVTHRFLSRVESGAIALSYPDGALTLRQRVLLLLTSLEEVPVETAAGIIGMPLAEASASLREARTHLRSAAAADVLIIEDEPIIAMDIEELVQSCGHNVVGVASSEAEAFAIASRTRPTLILADINLGLGGDGAAAVARIVRDHRVPVIFVTAYPERLLTGEVVEPAFVITKPFEPVALAIATYQAVTGGVVLA
jgi:CheY-like chemotaxis protein/DNA-directed RNA polymerase specialized sigma24 family protein